MDKPTVKAPLQKFTKGAESHQVKTKQNAISILENIINQFNLIDIYRTIYPTTAKYT